MTRSRFSAVLFDCDGVLVDSEPITNRVLRTMLIELGWEISERGCIDLFIGRALKDEWAVIQEHTGFRIDDVWLASFRARRDDALRVSLVAIPGAQETVRAVAALMGDQFACVTGADRPKVEMQLKLVGLDQYFGSRVFSGMEVPRSKPAPDVYLAAANALKIDPTTAVVIEDSVAGVTAGVAAGATVFGFAPASPTHTKPEVLRAAGASLVFTDMADLPGLLGA
ncbi:HAD family phosphatase [Actinoplanes sp. TBRC 11911]|uniref:HAD family hydrolase n=1 Tax=Actinoplanes sp. TBRC 11911 TaxID=2729386 RepID=UPI00145F6270|nr:HAD family phosphatase [Actinoplanes sp. TBRC 11911]NMO55191.1 HAD family phosphatase [Actinoplanes sp. TBRC 11911]